MDADNRDALVGLIFIVGVVMVAVAAAMVLGSSKAETKARGSVLGIVGAAIVLLSTHIH